MTVLELDAEHGVRRLGYRALEFDSIFLLQQSIFLYVENDSNSE